MFPASVSDAIFTQLLKPNLGLILDSSLSHNFSVLLHLPLNDNPALPSSPTHANILQQEWKQHADGAEKVASRARMCEDKPPPQLAGAQGEPPCICSAALQPSPPQQLEALFSLLLGN